MRPNSLPGLLRRLVLLRWQRLSRRSRLAILVGAAALGAAAIVGASTCAFGGCPLRSGGCPVRSGCPYSAHAQPPHAPGAGLTDDADVACPHARQAGTD